MASTYEEELILEQINKINGSNYTYSKHICYVVSSLIKGLLHGLNLGGGHKDFFKDNSLTLSVMG